MKQAKQNYTQVTDLGLATAISLFFPIEQIDRTNPRRAVFSFDSSKELEQLISKYYSNELEYSLAQYFQQLSIVKSRLYSES